jgi:hypothetical protein
VEMAQLPEMPEKLIVHKDIPITLKTSKNTGMIEAVKFALIISKIKEEGVEKMTPTKQHINQHDILHQHFPNDCCLCKKEQEIARLKKENEELRKNKGLSLKAYICPFAPENEILTECPMKKRAEKAEKELGEIKKRR